VSMALGRVYRAMVGLVRATRDLVVADFCTGLPHRDKEPDQTGE
jgi:hypothetical protein